MTFLQATPQLSPFGWSVLVIFELGEMSELVMCLES